MLSPIPALRYHPAICFGGPTQSNAQKESSTVSSSTLSQQELDRRLEAATDAAKQAGRIIMRYFNQKTYLSQDHKDPNEVVTEADKKADAKIVEVLKRYFPHDNFLTEETYDPSTPIDLTPGTWVVDPIDGTTNFANKLPMFVTSIAYVQNNQTQVGVIYNPVTRELYTVKGDEPPEVNGKPMRVSTHDKLHMSLLSLPLTIPKKIKPHVKPRRLGTGALELAMVARGALHGQVTMNIKPWDLAAGVRMVENAGGKITNLAGNPLNLSDKKMKLIASNGKMHPFLLDIFKP